MESLGKYNELKDTLGEEKTLARVLAGSRDNARIPMQWNREASGGFTMVILQGPYRIKEEASGTDLWVH